MKRLLFILVLFSVQSQAQEAGWAQWHAVDGQLYWQYTYWTDTLGSEAMADQVNALLRSKAYIKNIVSKPGEISADIENMSVDYRRYTHMNINGGVIANAIAKGKWRGRLLAEVKDNRYRITITGMEAYIGKMGVYWGFGVGTSRDIGATAQDVFLTKEGEIKTARRGDLFIFDQYLINEMDLKKVTVKKDF